MSPEEGEERPVPPVIPKPPRMGDYPKKLVTMELDDVWRVVPPNTSLPPDAKLQIDPFGVEHVARKRFQPLEITNYMSGQDLPEEFVNSFRFWKCQLMALCMRIDPEYAANTEHLLRNLLRKHRPRSMKAASSLLASF